MIAVGKQIRQWAKHPVGCATVIVREVAEQRCNRFAVPASGLIAIEHRRSAVVKPGLLVTIAIQIEIDIHVFHAATGVAIDHVLL